MTKPNGVEIGPQSNGSDPYKSDPNIRKAQKGDARYFQPNGQGYTNDGKKGSGFWNWGGRRNEKDDDPEVRKAQLGELAHFELNGVGYVYRNKAVSEGSEDILRDGEEASFRNAVQGHSADQTAKSKTKLRRASPMIIAGLAIVMFMGLMGGSQSFMLFSFVAQLKSNFNTMAVSSNLRTTAFLKMQLNTGRVKNCVRSTIFGKQFTFSTKQIEKLTKNSSIRFEYDANNTKKIVNMSFIDVDGNRKIVTADNFEHVYNTNQKFRSEYYENSKTWRGAVAQWFDDHTGGLFGNSKTSRNKFGTYKEKDVESNKQQVTEATKQSTPDSTSSSIESKYSAEEETDAEGKPNGEVKVVEKDQSATMELSDKILETDNNGKPLPAAKQSKIKAKLDDFTAKYAKITGFANAATTGVCTIMNVATAIGLTIRGSQMASAIAGATTILEAGDKGKSPDASRSPINPVNSFWTQRAKETYTVNGEEVVIEGAAAEAPTVQSKFENTVADGNDPTIQPFLLQTFIKNAMGSINTIPGLASAMQGGMNFSLKSFKGCTAAKLVAALGDMVSDGISVAACFFSFGITCVYDAFKNMGVSMGFAKIISKVVEIAVPAVTAVLARSVLSELVGPSFGNAVVMGAQRIMSANHRSQGGAFMSPEYYKAFALAQIDYDRQVAQYERENLSPFDTSSKNTFLGSIYYSSIPVMSKMTSITGGISAISSLLSKSVRTILPGASAYDNGSKIAAQIDYSKNCPFSDGLTVTDEFCSDLVGTDVTTRDLDVADVINTIDIVPGNFAAIPKAESESNPEGTYLADANLAVESVGENLKIGEDGRMARWLIECETRAVDVGVPSQESIDRATPSTGIKLLDGAINATPAIGDAVEVVNNGMILANSPYILGNVCIMGSNTHGSVDAIQLMQEKKTELAAAKTEEDKMKILQAAMGDTSSPPSWSEAKYYQRFAEDQRLAEAMGIIEKSAVTAFLEKYYEEHPLDNSYEGIIARYSGLKKETVVAVLDLIDYAQFMANYEPDNMYPLDHPEEEAPVYAIESSAPINIDNFFANTNKYTDDRRQLALIG